MNQTGAGADLVVRAKALQAAGDLDGAAALCGGVSNGDPAYGEAQHVLGLVRYQQKRPDEALPHLEAVVAADPTNGAALNSLALVHIARDDGRAAESACRKALAIEPRFVLAHVNLGHALMRQERLPEAEKVLLDAYHINAKDTRIHRALVKLYAKMDRPATAGYWHGLGLLADRKPEPAIPVLEDAVSRAPRDHRIRTVLGRALAGSGRYDEAIDAHEAALSYSLGNVTVLRNLALALTDANRHAEALAIYDRLVDAGEESVNTGIAHGQTLLAMGRFVEGWAAFEHRLGNRHYSQESVRPPLTKPRWDGRPLDGGRLLVRTEQGKGDILQFVRFLPLAKSSGARVVFECEPELIPLMAPELGYDEIVEKVFSPEAPYPAHDAQISLISLAALFRIDESKLPGRVPYIAPPADRLPAWRGRLAGDGLAVGLVWAGNPQHPNDALRSLDLAALAPLSGVAGVRFFSLQVGGRSDDPAPAGLSIERLDRDLGDYGETAAALTALDLLITVDTSVAHLAGALGRPVWTLVPFASDWRWLVGRVDSPWYPSMRLFRQPRPRDWRPVIDEVRAALDEAAVRGTVTGGGQAADRAG